MGRRAVNLRAQQVARRSHAERRRPDSATLARIAAIDRSTSRHWTEISSSKHWDVVQDEAARPESKSGLPMCLATDELLAAAHAGCYAMALSFALGSAGHPPAELNVTAGVNLEKVGEGFAITSIALEVGARITGIDPPKFETIAERAKRECPLSKALAATPITLSAKLL